MRTRSQKRDRRTLAEVIVYQQSNSKDSVRSILGDFGGLSIPELSRKIESGGGGNKNVVKHHFQGFMSLECEMPLLQHLHAG